MDEQTATSELPNNDGASEKSLVDFHHSLDELSINNDELIKHRRMQKVKCIEEPYMRQHHAPEIPMENAQSNNHEKLQNEPIVPDSIVADRALELFSEALLSDSDVESSGQIVSVHQDDSSVMERVLSKERRVHFADELPQDTECSDQLESEPGTQGYNLHSLQELKSGVEYEAEYLGSTPILLEGRLARMQQAEAAVALVKDPENGPQPHIPIRLKISTDAIKIADSKVDLMDHPLHTISFVADVGNTLVIMVRLPPSTTSKMTCHVLDACNVRHLTLVIGEAFTAAYRDFLALNGIKEEDIEEAELNHVLNSQSASCVELDSFVDDSKTKQIVFHKTPGEIMGIVIMESGYGSPIPTCVVAYMDKIGAAARCGLLNVGDHIMSINGVSVIGLPLKACIHQIKKCKALSVVRMAICSCPPVLDLTILRPNVKFQLGFSVQDGIICSLRRGTIAERSGVRVGHKIIEVNGISTVGLDHSHVVGLLTNTVGDLHIRSMPYLMYQLVTGEVSPEYY